MSLPRRDRLVPKPKTTQHAWMIEGSGAEAKYRQVFIVAWRSHSYRWHARVVYTVKIDGEAEEAIVQRWVPQEVLRPVPADPNRAFGYR